MMDIEARCIKAECRALFLEEERDTLRRKLAAARGALFVARADLRNDYYKVTDMQNERDDLLALVREYNAANKKAGDVIDTLRARVAELEAERDEARVRAARNHDSWANAEQEIRRWEKSYKAGGGKV